MNMKDHAKLCKVDAKACRIWYNKVRKMLLSREFESLENCDKDAKVIHHLRDTEEQRKYNDEHYELFGFEIDKDGNEYFEYGKYVVFWTKDHHDKYHRLSEETRKKISSIITDKWKDEAFRNEMCKTRKGRKQTEQHRCRVSESLHGHKVTDDTRQKLREFNLGRKHSDETKKKISESHKKYDSVEYMDKLSRASKANWQNDEYRNRVSDKMRIAKQSESSHKKTSESLTKVMRNKSHLYKEYKAAGGQLKWNDFQTALSNYELQL